MKCVQAQAGMCVSVMHDIIIPKPLARTLQAGHMCSYPKYTEQLSSTELRATPLLSRLAPLA